MQVEIVQASKNFGYVFLELQCEKHAASISVGPEGVRVVNRNASHRAWGGMGRAFPSLEEARAGYKSSAMRAMFDAAEEWLAVDAFAAA